MFFVCSSTLHKLHPNDSERTQQATLEQVRDWTADWVLVACKQLANSFIFHPSPVSCYSAAQSEFVMELAVKTKSRNPTKLKHELAPHDPVLLLVFKSNFDTFTLQKLAASCHSNDNCSFRLSQVTFDWPAMISNLIQNQNEVYLRFLFDHPKVKLKNAEENLSASQHPPSRAASAAKRASSARRSSSAKRACHRNRNHRRHKGCIGMRSKVCYTEESLPLHDVNPKASKCKDRLQGCVLQLCKQEENKNAWVRKRFTQSQKASI